MARRIYCPVKEIPDERFQEAAEDHLGNYHYKVDTGNVSHILRTQSLLCACLPVGVYNHKEWAKVSEGFKTKLFRVVNMFTAPSPVDPDIPKHVYPRIKRDINLAQPITSNSAAWCASHFLYTIAS